MKNMTFMAKRAYTLYSAHQTRNIYGTDYPLRRFARFRLT